jgi:hypothetical protein
LSVKYMKSNDVEGIQVHIYNELEKNQGAVFCPCLLVGICRADHHLNKKSHHSAYLTMNYGN